MAQVAARFVPADDGTVLDRDTGLCWERAPAPSAVPWEAAARRPEGTPWRLPTASELLVLLHGMRGGHPFAAPRPGTLLWSSTASPFSVRGQVRAIGCEPGPVYVVRLLDRDAIACAWRVRARPATDL